MSKRIFLPLAFAGGAANSLTAAAPVTFWNAVAVQALARPKTAIQYAAIDGNERTKPDSTWQPFRVTPPATDYPSTHTLVGAASEER